MIPTLVPAPTQIGSDLKSFLIQNNILTTMAAVTMAFSTGTMIRSLVADIILPGIYFLILSRVKVVSSVISGAFAPISHVNIDNFLKEILSWIVVIIVTFILIEYVVRRYFFNIHPVKQDIKPVLPEAVFQSPIGLQGHPVGQEKKVLLGPVNTPGTVSSGKAEQNNSNVASSVATVDVDEFSQFSKWNW